ncbi:MAG: hypothetical protein QOG45_2717 [Chloroflexota bacterium]|jgi:uncharacterized protein (TIGR00725 family)|nr:hypothetical protein [Chloroflexota bacterium]
MARPVLVAVCGPGQAGAEEERLAEEVGRRLAEAGAVVLCGGLGGVMAAAARGARAAGGLCVGLLPGDDPQDADPEVGLALPTGLGELRNGLLVRACGAVVAIGGAYGTLSEIGFALRLGRPVVGLHTWELRRPGAAAPDPGVLVAGSAAEAVERALTAVVRRGEVL